MMQFAVTSKPAAPVPSRISAWGKYDVFTVANGEQIFLAVVSDTQWALFCERCCFDDLAQAPRLATNNLRVSQRTWMLPLLRERLARHTLAELAEAFEAVRLPYAPIRAPHELLDDPHLRPSGGLAAMKLPDDRKVVTPLLPVVLDGQRPGLRREPPAVGQEYRRRACGAGLRRTRDLRSACGRRHRVGDGVSFALGTTSAPNIAYPGSAPLSFRPITNTGRR